MTKTIICIKRVLFGLFLMGFFNSAHAVTISFDFSTMKFQINEPFSIDLVTSTTPSESISHFMFNLDFLDTEFALDCVHVWPGRTDPAFEDNSELFSNSDVAGAFFDRFAPLATGPQGNDILLATLTFTPLVSGDALLLGISGVDQGLWVLVDHGPMMMPEWVGTDINLSRPLNVQPTPEPSTLILLGLGLCGAARFRFRFQRDKQTSK